MNKIFKIVFNAARGKMMVVNEATSSVQTGKKAAVTVAVIGALVSGFAQAQDIDWDNDTLREIKSITGIVKTTSGSPKSIHAGKEDQAVTSSSVTVFDAEFVTTTNQQWPIFGGSRLNANQNNLNTPENSLVSVKNSSGNLEVYGGGRIAGANSKYYSESASVVLENVAWIVASNDNLNYIAGRAFGAGYLQANNSSMTFEKTDVLVIDTVAGDGNGRIYGGGFLYQGDNNSLLTINKSSVTIQGEDTVLNHVIGGNLTASSATGLAEVKSSHVTIEAGEVDSIVGANHLNWFGNVKSGQSTVTVVGGVINDEVVGGNYIDAGSAVTDDNVRNVSAGTTTIDIQGGTVNEVVGGNYIELFSDTAKVSVETKSTSVTVGGVTVKGNVVAGDEVYTDGNNNRASNATTKITDSVSLTMVGTNVEGNLITIDNLVGGNVKDTFAATATMSLTNVNAPNAAVVASKGTVELRVEGADGKNVFGSLDIDGATLVMSADGAFNDATGGDVDALAEAVLVNGKTIEAEGVSVKLDEGTVMGAVSVASDGTVVTQVNKKTEALAEQVTLAPQMITRIMMNDVRKRMGDLRAAEGTHGVWARYNGGQMAGSGMEADFNMVQVGIDTVPVVDALRFGVAFSYAQTEADATNGLATTDMDAFSLAFYGTKMYDNGMFVDVIGRMATMDTEMTVQGNKAEMDNVALSLSGELGWRFDVTDQFFIEPSAELTYTYTNADTFKMGQGTYELESVDSLVGRAGFAAGFKCPANKGDVYVRAAVVHEFMGDSTMNSMINGRPATPVESDGKDTYFEYAVGAQFNVNKNTYVYADVERTEGANVDEDWRANVGVRFAF